MKNKEVLFLSNFELKKYIGSSPEKKIKTIENELLKLKEKNKLLASFEKTRNFTRKEIKNTSREKKNKKSLIIY